MNGHADCITVLVEHKAQVDMRDASGTASFAVHEAARYGHCEALRALINGKADVNVTNGKNLTALDVARECRHENCAALIAENDGKESSKLRVRVSPRTVNRNRKSLIVSTGDISDIDGFFALAQYAKTGSDVLFVMNYPAYINVSEDRVDTKFDSLNPGLGYMYNAKSVHEYTIAA